MKGRGAIARTISRKKWALKWRASRVVVQGFETGINENLWVRCWSSNYISDQIQKFCFYNYTDEISFLSFSSNTNLTASQFHQNIVYLVKTLLNCKINFICRYIYATTKLISLFHIWSMLGSSVQKSKKKALQFLYLKNFLSDNS